MTASEILAALPKLRRALAKVRAHPDQIPHMVEHPVTGEMIDLLDGTMEGY